MDRTIYQPHFTLRMNELQHTAIPERTAPDRYNILYCYWYCSRDFRHQSCFSKPCRTSLGRL